MMLAAVVLLLAARTATAIDVVTTSASGGMLVREIAHEHATVEILAPPDRDLHYLQARPSMIPDTASNATPMVSRY